MIAKFSGTHGYIGLGFQKLLDVSDRGTNVLWFHSSPGLSDLVFNIKSVDTGHTKGEGSVELDTLVECPSVASSIFHNLSL